MKHFIAVVLFAIVAGLVSCEVASVNGVKGIPATVRQTLGLPEGGAVSANFKAVGIEGADIKAKVSKIVSETKSKVADVTEKAIEAAQPDRSKTVTPQSDNELTDSSVRNSDSQPAEIAEVPTEPDVLPEAGNGQSEKPSETATPVPGTTHFYGTSEGTAVAAWAGAATMNPDYEPAVVPGDAAADAQSNEASATTAPDAAVDAAPLQPQEESDVVTEAQAPEPVADAASEAAPASLGGIGQTSYFGFADKPDADQTWAAAAAPNPDYTPVAAAPEAADSTNVQPEAAPAATAPAEQERAVDATESSTDEQPPQSLGGLGQTSYYGLASIPDEDQPWAAAAQTNPDYTPSAAVSAAVVNVAPEPPVASPEPQQTQPAVAAPEPAVPVEEQAPPAKSEPGQSSYYGEAEKPDASQAWAAPAKPNPDYTTAVAAVDETPPATQQAVEACRDALNAEAQIGGLNFALTRWDITPDKYGLLDKLAKLAKDCGGVVIEVHGHTDNTGKPTSNKTLSDLRAKAVVTYLTRAGVPLSKLKAVGLGEGKPVGDNSTVEGRRQNRRIEFVVTGG